MIRKKSVPFDFVLELLAEMEPYTKLMFGCTSVYVGSRIVFILRDRGNPAPDDGVWIATTADHHASLRAELPSMRDIELFGPGPTGWQVLPVSADGFEESVRLACEMVLKGDERIGKTPKTKLGRSSEKTKKTSRVEKKIARGSAKKKKAGSSESPALQTPKSSNKSRKR
ncbi:MAG: hypothetical protein V4760_17505 [Bdellovibrionota bacterium]